MRNSLFIKFCACKDSANRRQYKISSLIFIVEMPPILFKDSANRRQYKILLCYFMQKGLLTGLRAALQRVYLVASHEGDAVKQSSD